MCAIKRMRHYNWLSAMLITTTEYMLMLRSLVRSMRHLLLYEEGRKQNTQSIGETRKSNILYLLKQNRDPMNDFFLWFWSPLFRPFIPYKLPYLTVDLLLQMKIGGFHLQLLVLTFVYQFYSRVGILVHLSFAND